jgi:hypothetical protein
MAGSGLLAIRWLGMFVLPPPPGIFVSIHSKDS